MRNRYVNFFTDFAFKRLFGSEMSKNILLDFLNELLYQEQGRIVSLTYLKNEQMGRREVERKAVYDLYCENERGEKFIVEIQQASHKYFKDRTLFYATFPLVEQARRGDWTFELTPVYVIAILGFVFDEDKEEPDKYRYNVKLADIDTGKVFYDKLTFIYLAMPKFTKQEHELCNRFEKWLYILKNLDALDRIPDMAREEVFEEFFRMAEIIEMSKAERDAYDASLKVLRDNYSVLMTAQDKGREEGRAEGEAVGEARGLAKGRAEGRVEGLAEGRHTLLTRLLTRKFGPQALTPPLQQRLHAATIDQLDHWGERLLDAQSVDEVFREN